MARSYQAVQPHAEALDQLRIVHTFINSFDADAYVKAPRPVKQLRQDIMLLRHVPANLRCPPYKPIRDQHAFLLAMTRSIVLQQEEHKVDQISSVA